MSVVSKGSDVADEWSCLRDYQTNIFARVTGDLSRDSRELEIRQRILISE